MTSTRTMEANIEREMLLYAEDMVTGYAGRFEAGPLTARVDGGEVWGLVGPNGSGKTTILRALCGMLPCRRGRVLLEGCDIRPMPARRRARLLAWLPQALEPPVSFTVRELVSLGRLPYASAWLSLSAADEAAIDAALTVMELRELASRPLHELSAGERQRAIVAMALAQQPRVLILDEPTAHLDIQHAARLMSATVRWARERRMSIVVSLHDLNLAAAYCHKLVLLNRGSVVTMGERCDVLRQDVLERVYGMPMDVIRGANDSMAILPRYGVDAGGGSDSGATTRAAG